MDKVIKTFSDNSCLKYDKGDFDDWCVYLVKSNGFTFKPRDHYYFTQLQTFAKKYTAEKIYATFIQVYNLVTKEVRKTDINFITKLASTYPNDALEMDILLTILYMTMIAEENKKNTKLGKRIKRLGVHTLLIENKDINHAINFMRGMRAPDIIELCKKRGF